MEAVEKAVPAHEHWDVDSANPEILTGEEDDGDDEDDDVEIDCQQFIMYVISCKQWAWFYVYVQVEDIINFEIYFWLFVKIDFWNNICLIETNQRMEKQQWD